MPNTMKAAIARQFGEPLAIEEVPIPEMKPGKILVKLIASGVCHTDLHAVSGDWPVKPVLPLIPGHEGAGIVVAIGEDVTNRFKVGDRVGVAWLHSACGHCEYCLSGWETLCQFQQNTGYSMNGCYAEYVLADANYVARLPETLDYAAAASILCAGLTVYKGIKETETRPGQWLVISGVGGLGHMAVQYAKAMGLHVIAVDIHPPQLALAQQLNADIVINAAEEDPVAKIQRDIGGAHGVLATAVSTESFSQAINMLRRRGTLVMVGLPPGNFTLPIFDMVVSRKTVRGSIVGTRLDLQEALAFAAEKKVAVQYQLDQLANINAIFSAMKTGKVLGRTVLEIATAGPCF